MQSAYPSLSCHKSEWTRSLSLPALALPLHSWGPPINGLASQGGMFLLMSMTQFPPRLRGSAWKKNEGSINGMATPLACVLVTQVN